MLRSLFLFAAALSSVITPAACQTQTPTVTSVSSANLMPVPAEAHWGAARLSIKGQLSVQLETDSDPAVREASARFVARLAQRTKQVDAGKAPGLTIHYGRAGQAKLGEDESYSLRVTPMGIALTSATSIGALRGLATLEQLVVQDKKGFYFPEVDITDQPRFAWRGLLMDAARHFMPVSVVKRNLDGMAAVKLNVLHWHLSDDQGFRVESKLFPRLQQVGGEGHYYTQDQVKEIVRYAAARGIRVIPEFDMPGHTTALIAANPTLASNDSTYGVTDRWGILNIAIDPTRESTYEFLDKLFGEMTALFPDPYFHIGGDENDGRQWKRNPRIAAFMRENHMVKANGQLDNHALQTHFNRRILPLLTKYGKTMVGWDEILGPGLPESAVIQSWRGRKGLFEAAKAGHATLLSNGYYIDLNYGAASHYLNDPLPADAPLTDAQKKLILGGEATMWSEFVDSTIVDSRIWPRAAAVAERLWSPATVRDVPDMYRRLAAVSDEMELLGLQHRRAPEQLLKQLAAGRDVAPLRTLASVIEPVKEYKRHFQGFKYTTRTPLNRLVDAALPESEVAHQFGVQVDKLVQGISTETGSRMPKDASARAALIAVQTQLAQWQVNDKLLQPTLAASPSLQEYAPLSVRLSALSGLALEHLRMLEKGEVPSAAWQAAALKQVEAAKAPAGQTELVVVDSLRKLLAS
ncbi:beta-N-acetylhexosaminidase [Hymenobacter jejuensis]|uniref:Beta-hexosaminidase n=1 Tax=Hymenobacter jejuensis TaxID=2502781 RepID=A0A5B8A178_9BACT|nr:family 20 glycosylhydrolase [Hymenobacter jejuensis]QDA61131.1 beta-hexosaminidase [Hymenobacter jejuensis]